MGSNGVKRPLIPKDKAEIAKRASDHGIAVTIHFYGRNVRPALRESTVQTWKKQYLLELKQKRAAGEEMSTMTLPGKKRGRPLLLDVELDLSN